MNLKKFLLKNPVGWGILFFVAIVIGNIIYYFVTKFNKVVTVRKIYDVYVRRSSKGLMFEDDVGNVYSVTNVWFKGEFDSMEDWNKLKVGSQFQIEGYGKRIPFLGMYPKVYSVIPK